MTSNSYDVYANPLVSRYASTEMKYVFSDQKKFSTWRRLWLELAKAQKKLGLPVTDEQIAEIESHLDDLNIEGGE